MVKNNGNSLRNSMSSISLRTTAQDYASQTRIAELEAQVAKLTAEANLSPNPQEHELRISLPILLPDGRVARWKEPQHNGYGYDVTDKAQEERDTDNMFYRRANGSMASLEPAPTANPYLMSRLEKAKAKAMEEYYERMRKEGSEFFKKHYQVPFHLAQKSPLKSPEAYTQPFCDFLTENPTVWHAVDYFEKKLETAGFSKVGHTVFTSRSKC